MVSDARVIGYAVPFVRGPVEVYGNSNLHTDGVQFSKRLSLADSSITTSLVSEKANTTAPRLMPPYPNLTLARSANCCSVTFNMKPGHGPCVRAHPLARTTMRQLE